MAQRVQRVLHAIAKLSGQVWGSQLVGVYLHGSLAMNCFHWESSDIDFVVVLHAAPTQAQKEAYLSGLLLIHRDGPPKGLEMSIVLAEYAQRFVYPTPYELHFSAAHLQKCVNDLAGYCQEMTGTDKDLAAHFTIIKHRGMPLLGPGVGKVFGDVPAEIYLDSIRHDIEAAPQAITRDPVYYILNLCRVLAYRLDGLVLSKQEGGAWGLARLEASYGSLVRQAMGCYQSGQAFPLDGAEPALRAFATYMCACIFAF